MPPHHTNQSSDPTVHRQLLADNLDRGNLVMRPCSECVSHGFTCLVGKESSKCNECVHSSTQKCNLILTETEWAKVKRECLHLRQEVHNATAQLLQLQKQQDLIKTHWDEMVWWKLQNIKELEADEAHESSEAVAMPSLDNFLLNVLSDQVEMLVGFDPFF